MTCGDGRRLNIWVLGFIHRLITQQTAQGQAVSKAQAQNSIQKSQNALLAGTE